MSRFLGFCAVFTVLFIFYGDAIFAAPPEVRVMVADSLKAVTIESQGGGFKMFSPGGGYEKTLGAKAYVTSGEDGLKVNRMNVGKEIVFSNSKGRYKISGKTFRGKISAVWKSPNLLMIVDHISLEDYLGGLINSEISSSWPVESIKAQAVAARTYAMNQIEGQRRSKTQKGYDLTSTVLDQVYEGAHQEDARSIEAVLATRGEFLLRNGKVFPTFYHSCCGGETESAGNVWKGEIGPPLVKDMYCAGSPKFFWSYSISASELSSMLSKSGVNVGQIKSVDVSILKDSPRNEMLLIEDDSGLKMLKATELRKIVGYKNVKSTWFDVEMKGNNISFKGRGYGHGVGLCQWGAKGMAEDGIGYKDILKFYYSDADVVKLY